MSNTSDSLAGEELAMLCEAVGALVETRRWDVLDHWAILPYEQREQWRLLTALQEKPG